MKNNLSGTKKFNPNYMIRMMELFIKEKRVTFDKRARKIGLELLEKDITPEQRANILINLTTVATRLKEDKEVMLFGTEALKNNIPENQRIGINKRLKGIMEAKNKEIDNLRCKLYIGNIDCKDLKELVQNNNEILVGCIFIAETCKYLRLEQLGMQCLKGFSKSNSELNTNEKKAITQAIEILKRKKPAPSIKSEWDEVYRTLSKTSNLETNDSGESRQ